MLHILLLLTPSLAFPCFPHSRLTLHQSSSSAFTHYTVISHTTDTIIITITTYAIVIVITLMTPSSSHSRSSHTTDAIASSLSSLLSTHIIVMPIIITTVYSSRRHPHHHLPRLTPSSFSSPPLSTHTSPSSSPSLTTNSIPTVQVLNIIHDTPPPPPPLPPPTPQLFIAGMSPILLRESFMSVETLPLFGRRLLLPVFGSCRRVESRAGWLSGVGSECHLG